MFNKGKNFFAQLSSKKGDGFFVLGTFFLGASIGTNFGAPGYWVGALLINALVYLLYRGINKRPSSEAIKIDPEAPSVLSELAAVDMDPLVPEDRAVEADTDVAAMLTVAESAQALEASVGAPMLTPTSSALFNKTDWEFLLRNAQDGGTNSILASHVLKKTALILEAGNLQALEMKAQSEEVFFSTQEMTRFVGEISAVAKSAKVVSFNLMVEASRHNASTGGPIMIVAKEMTALSESIKTLTLRIEQKINSVAAVANNNQQKCTAVSNLFGQINAELNQFKFLMARIEELSISQCEKIRSYEDHTH